METKVFVYPVYTDHISFIFQKPQPPQTRLMQPEKRGQQRRTVRTRAPQRKLRQQRMVLSSKKRRQRPRQRTLNLFACDSDFSV
jgi:hypothetical protein